MKNLITCLTLFAVIFLLSCERESFDTTSFNQNDNLVLEARQYFEKNLLASNSRTSQKEWYRRKQPQWSKAIKIKVDGKDVVEVPLLVDGQEPVYTLNNPVFGNKGIIKQKNGVTKALFFKQADGTIKEYVLKLILSEDYYAKVIDTYKSLSLQDLKQNFSGFVIFTDWNDKSLDEYFFENGKAIATTRIDFGGKQSANAKASTCMPICQNVCLGMSLPCCTMKSNPTDYCCITTFNTCHPQCYYICYPDSPVVQPVIGVVANSQVFTANYKVTGPTNPIDIAKRLDCFGSFPNDSRYKYSVTIYVDQPVDGTRDVANFSLSETSRRPGHTYLGFEQLDSKSGNVIRLVAGFYVQSEMTAAMNVATASAWGDDGGTPYDVSLKVDLSASQFKDVIYQIKYLGNPMYHLVNNNCTTFAYQTISPYVTLPSGKGSIGPLGIGYNPADLGQDLRERKDAYGDKMNVSNGAKSPTSVNCK